MRRGGRRRLALLLAACPVLIVAGFWLGIWHGLISPITFVISLFTHGVRLYEIHNNGSWYNFGFVIGAGLFLSGGILGRKNRDRRR